MTVVGLHPEQLIDKLEAGELSNAERAQLDAHLSVCEACRIELATRCDFAADAPLAFPEHPELMLELPEPEPEPELELPSVRRLSTRAVRGGRHRRLALLAVAATLCASGALAALSNRQLPWRIWFRAATPTVSQAVGAKPAASNGRAKRARAMGAAASAALEAPQASTEVEPSAASSSEAPALTATAGEAHSLGSPDRRTQSARPPELAAANSASAALAANSAQAIPSGSAEFPPIASGAPESAEPSATDAASLFAAASRARRDGNTGRAITLYHQLEQDYPSSSESQLSVALLAKLMLDRGDAEAAAADYDRYLHEGTPVLSAEALVGRAHALEQLGKREAAIAAWQDVQERFPGSVHARLAAARIAALGSR